MIGNLLPNIHFFCQILSDNEFHRLLSCSDDLQIIIIHHFGFYRERLAVKRYRRHLLAAQIVFHRHNRV